MSEASAVTTVDSAPAKTEFNGWDASGTPIRVGKETPAAADSAPANEKKDNAAPDSAPDKDKSKSADNASASAPEKDTQKPHRKDKEDTAERFKELLDELKAIRAERDELKRGKSSDTRETQQKSQPAKEEYQPLDEKKFFTDNPKATYEEYVRASAKHEAKWESRQEIAEALAQERRRIAQESAAKDLQAKVEDGRKRYDDFDSKVFPALEEIVSDAKVPLAVKAMLDGSDVLVDVLYVLRSDEKEWAAFRKLSQSNPAAAIRKLVLTEQLVHTELAKGKNTGGEKDKTSDESKSRDSSGKFVSEKDKSSDEKKDGASDTTKPRAPKPPSEVGGRGTAPEDALRSAAAANDFKAFEAEQNRRLAARMTK